MGHGVTYIDMCPYKIAVVNLMGNDVYGSSGKSFQLC